jgi:CopG family nickel-responsive transcriptional regulator
MERFTISLDDKLALEFDTWVAQRGYANRSEAFRDIVRAEMDRNKVTVKPKGQCVACLSYVFNHHERDLAVRLAHLQHEHHDLTLSTMHSHLDHEHCIETVLLRGSIAAVQAFADALCAERGVHHGKLNLISVDVHLPHAHKKGEKAHTHIKPST